MLCKNYADGALRNNDIPKKVMSSMFMDKKIVQW